eukprot:3780879-Pleurochrysis_carterae.AAC.3
MPVVANDFVSWGRTTIDHLAVLELALEVRGDEVPSAHKEPIARRESGEGAQRCGSHGSAESLLVVDTVDLRAALNAQAGFERTAAFPLVDPYKSYEVAIVWHIRPIDHAPATIGFVVCYFGALSSHPA